jgi:hypothetical protein
MSEATCNVLLGALIALAGTVLTTLVRYWIEQHQRRTQRRERRHEGVRRYLIACLKLADLAWVPAKVRNVSPAGFGTTQFEQWDRLWTSQLTSFYSLPASWAVSMYADDDELLQLLDQVQDFRLALGAWSLGVTAPSEALDPPVTYNQVQEVVRKARKRLDALEDKWR